MLRLAADEDFDNRIVAGVLRRMPRLDIVRAQDTGLRGADDPTVLAWAASEGRVLLTHDVNTLIESAYERIADGARVAGVFAVPQELPIGTVIEDILLLVECSLEGEWEGRVEYLPLR
jgi:hypothetical protein